MKKAAVLGHPISHSKSPLIHRYWLQQHAIDGSYEAIDTPPAELSERLKTLAEQGYAGANLTVPLKETVIPLLAKQSAAAQAIGAVNLVQFIDGEFHGSNSDAYGFMAHLQASAPKLGRKKAVILGAGGAAAAVVYALADLGFETIVVTNRTRTRASKLRFKTEVVDWDDRHDALIGADLLVNTTTLGMEGQPKLTIDLGKLPTSAAVYDIVYSPLETRILQQAKSRGLITIDGLGMLLHQAAPAFGVFFGTRPEVTPALRDFVLRPGGSAT